MVEQQVRPWDVLDAARARGDRHRAARGLRAAAHAQAGLSPTCALPLAHGETMMKPVVEGRMLQALRLAPDDEVLEIGTGSGLPDRLPGALAREVVSIDLHADFVDAARAAPGRDTASAMCASNAPMPCLRHRPPVRRDRVTAAVAEVPDTLHALAASPSGRLFVDPRPVAGAGSGAASRAAARRRTSKACSKPTSPICTVPPGPALHPLNPLNQESSMHCAFVPSPSPCLLCRPVRPRRSAADLHAGLRTGAPERSAVGGRRIADASRSRKAWCSRARPCCRRSTAASASATRTSDSSGDQQSRTTTPISAALLDRQQPRLRRLGEPEHLRPRATTPAWAPARPAPSQADASWTPPTTR